MSITNYEEKARALRALIDAASDEVGKDDKSRRKQLKEIMMHADAVNLFKEVVISSFNETVECKHCGRALTSPHFATHAEGNYRGKMRCDPEDSGLSYGYNAAPIYVSCDIACLGSKGEE